jgi:transcriptional regulator with XRE-family HTH domain
MILMSASFGKHLKEIREAKSISINQLAQSSGVSAPQISRIETGSRGTPKAETIRKLSEALQVPFEDMMREAGHFLAEDGADVYAKMSELKALFEKSGYHIKEYSREYIQRVEVSRDNGEVLEDVLLEDFSRHGDWILKRLKQEKDTGDNYGLAREIEKLSVEEQRFIWDLLETMRKNKAQALKK